MNKRILVLNLIILLIIISIGCSPSKAKSISNSNTFINKLNNKEELLITHFINVGQGDAILIQLPNKEKLLIDGGNNDAGSLVVDYIKELGIKRIDYMIATHPHADHIGGLDDVIKNFEIDKIYMPKVTHTSNSFKKLLLTIKNKGLKISTAQTGIKLINDSNLKVKLIAPIKNNYKELNNYSVITQIKYGRKSLLFTGDAEAKVEEELLNTETNLRANLIKIGHHGSNSSTTQEFLQTINPKHAVISVGENDYGHPTTFTLKKIKANDIKIYRTDQQGTIIAISDGKELIFNQKPITNQTTPKTKNINNNIEITTLNLKKELVIITNNTNKTLDISAWKLISLRGEQEFSFPQGTIIKPNSKIKVISGTNVISGQNQIVWTKRYIWNNNGDAAALYNNQYQLITDIIKEGNYVNY